MVDAKVGKSLAGKTYPITREAEVDKPGRNRFQRGGAMPRASTGIRKTTAG